MDQVEIITNFLTTTFKQTGKSTAIVAVSGGIDSALSLTLTVQALGKEHVYALFLPYGQQSTADSEIIAAWNKLDPDHILKLDIKPLVDLACKQLNIQTEDKIRRGNLMARTRMLVLYDYAKQLDALVVGTENKSEEYLGYFTRFGDAASDLEPIQHLTKTEVRELSESLGLPDVFRAKAPSAGLWEGQTDETELGFTYQQADQYIQSLENQTDSHLPPEIAAKIKARIASQEFKHLVPYKLKSKI